MQTGTLYTVSAPSGAGKTSLVKALTERDNAIQVSVSHTTRTPRPGETDGVNYHFTNHADFEAMIAENRFLEHAEVFGNYYGTSADWVNQQLSQGRDVLLEIDWQGAAQIKALNPNTVAVFILPPSIAALQQRLTGRGQDSEDVIQKRLAEAQNEMDHAHNADYIIINDDFSDALEDLAAVFKTQRLTAQQQQQRHSVLLEDLIRR